jgi:hypothetical protein
LDGDSRKKAVGELSPASDARAAVAVQQSLATDAVEQSP